MVSSLFHEDDGIIPNNRTCGQHYEKICKNDDHGAKHSPPGDRCPPDWSDGVPPVGILGSPLT